MPESMPQFNDTTINDTTVNTINRDSLAPLKPKVTIHTFFMVLTVMFIFAFAFVFGISYFLEKSDVRGQFVDNTCLLLNQPLCLTITG